ncbi:MAG: F0F1 ATP synthase subunit B [Candidatus Omnitrophota bacterium]|nr:F0F1 ATP synthase subunit B [Candidatus Omnitrophota bacterium]
MELLKLLSTNEIIAQVLGFLILLTLLRVFAWKKILGLLDKRKEYVVSELKGIEDAKADIAKIKLEYAANMASIEETAKEKLHQAFNESKIILEDARKSAHLAAQEIIDNAKKSVQYELAKAKDELKNEIIDLTVKAAENIIQEKLTGAGDRKIVENFLGELDKLE